MDLKVVFFACLVHQFKNVPLEMSLAPHEFFHYRWNVIFCWPQVPCWYLCRYLHSHSIWIYRYHQQRDTSWEQKCTFFNSIFFKRHLKWFQIQFFFVNCSCHWINWQSKKSCFVNSENLVVSIFVHLRMSRKLFYANLKMMHLCKFFKIPFCIF